MKYKNGLIPLGYRVIASMIMSICVILSIPYATTITDAGHSMHYGIMTLILFSVFTFIFFKAISIMNLRLLIISSIGSIFFSSAMVIGSDLTLNRLDVSYTKLFFSVFGFAVLLAALLAMILYYIPAAINYLYNSRIQNSGSKYFTSSLSYFLIVWAIIFICYIPALLAAYPGLYSYDAPFQLQQYNSGKFNSLIPPLHTLYMGICFSVGKNLFGSDSAGMLIYSLTQMLMMSAAFSYCCYFLAKKNAPVIIQIFSILFFALSPVNQIFVICTTKDVLFSAAFLIVVLFTIDMVMDSKKFFASYLLQVRYILALLLMFSLRNNGYYAFLLCIPFLLIVFRKYFLKIFLICLVCVISWNIITGPIYAALNIERGDSREALSVPIQQISRAVVYHYGGFTDEEKSAVTDLLGKEDQIKRMYLPWVSDPEKSNFDTKTLNSNLMYYVKNYVSIGLKYPRTYIYAFLELTFPDYYPDFVYKDKYGYILYQDRPLTLQAIAGGTHVVKNSKLPALDALYDNIFGYDSYQKIPVLSMIFSQGFMFWLLGITMLICLYQKRYKILLPLFMLLALWISILFGPIALIRYLYPLFVALPIMLMIVFKNKDKTEHA